MLKLIYGEIMKKLLFPIIMVAILIITVININPIANYFAGFLEVRKNVIILPGNQYTKNTDFLFVQQSNDFIPYSYQDLLNIIYSVLDKGWINFTFYCPTEYLDCINDVKSITEDQNILTHINNFVHPYNSFNNIKTIYDNSGEVNIIINHLYSAKDITSLNQKVAAVTDELITSTMNEEEKVLAIHDYIIKQTKYDEARNEGNYTPYKSNIAYGALLQGFAVCGGYADAMAIFLHDFAIDNYKVASAKHVWNAVKIDNKWLHLDLTWNDPVSNNGVDNLFHTYFLVTDYEMASIDAGSEDVLNHIYDKNIYLEFN